jgi:hypothetical protein
VDFGNKQRQPGATENMRPRQGRRTLRWWVIALPFFALALSAPSTVAAQEAAPEGQPQSGPVSNATRVTVQGAVRNSITGEPLARALVQVEGDADTGTLTDGEGHFEIPGVPTGPQTIRVVKPGFRDRPYATEEAGSQAEGPAHSVLVAAQMPELNFTLTPNGAIHGRIVLSTGDPATGITVQLFHRVVRFGRGVWVAESNARSNGDGAYRFGGLADGLYALETQPAFESEPAVSVVAPGKAANVVRNGFASVFYPDARDFSSAAKIHLSAGAQAEANFSLALEPFYTVTALPVGSGDLAGAGKMGHRGPCTGALMDASGQALPYPVQYDDATHSLQASLPDGTYALVVHGTPNVVNSTQNLNSFQLVDLAPSLNGNARGSAGAAEFTVAGHAVNGLHVPVGPQQTAVVHLRLVHNTDSPNAAATFSTSAATQLVNLNLEQANGASMNGGENVSSMSSQADSISFTTEPGSYWLSASITQKGLCLGAFTAGGVNLAREPLSLSLATSPPPMELTLRDDCGTLILSLPGALAAFLPGEEPFYIVYVVPDFDTVQDIPPMTIHASSGPTLTVDDLAPGSYHVYAFDSPVHLEYRDPSALAALPNAGQQVTVGAGATANLALEGLER